MVHSFRVKQSLDISQISQAYLNCGLLYLLFEIVRKSIRVSDIALDYDLAC